MPTGHDNCVFEINAGVTIEHYMVHLALGLTTYFCYIVLKKLIQKYWLARIILPIEGCRDSNRPMCDLYIEINNGTCVSMIYLASLKTFIHDLRMD